MIITQDIAALIFDEIWHIRRGYSHQALSHAQTEIEKIISFNIQVPKINHFIGKNQAIQFILPAFPMKSPNLNKVLGKLPDMAEQLSLSFLNRFCEKIKEMYQPGAELFICSDGRVFGDVIQVNDQWITAYQDALKTMIRRLNLRYLKILNLEDFAEFQQKSFDEMRQHLVEGYAEPLESIKQKLISDDSGIQLYRAMSRFLFEDSLSPENIQSKSSIQKDAKKRAIETIQRSWAWGDFLSQAFPDAIRFSIHPQPANSSKIGIHMMPTKDHWLTPWHGVAAYIDTQFVLIKRSEAIKMNGKLILQDQQPSYYEIPSQL